MLLKYIQGSMLCAQISSFDIGNYLTVVLLRLSHECQGRVSDTCYLPISLPMEACNAIARAYYLAIHVS